MFSVHVEALITKNQRHRYYNKQITSCGNGHVQYQDQERSKLNSPIVTNSGAHRLTGDKPIQQE